MTISVQIPMVIGYFLSFAIHMSFRKLLCNCFILVFSCLNLNLNFFYLLGLYLFTWFIRFT